MEISSDNNNASVIHPIKSELSVNKESENVVTLVHTVSFYRRQQSANVSFFYWNLIYRSVNRLLSVQIEKCDSIAFIENRFFFYCSIKEIYIFQKLFVFIFVIQSKYLHAVIRYTSVIVARCITKRHKVYFYLNINRQVTLHYACSYCYKLL